MSGDAVGDAVGETVDEAVARAAVLAARVVELEAAARAAVIGGALQAEALRAGMVDLDGLKLADVSGVTLDARGAVVGAAAVMAGLRRAKPWLFGGGNSSSTAAVPPAEAPRPRLAREMTHEEWQAGRRALLRG